jgi:dolichyl-phosphooligosaccharide-protein glycotransferase
MESVQKGWWHRHGWTVAILLGAFGITFAIRTIWAYPVIAEFGPLYTYGGGSDSYYHSRVMSYIIMTHRNLIFDPMLKYPVGSINPREPLFDWMNAILGIVFAPAFGGNAVNAGAWFLDLQAPLWAALGVFPLYLVGREVSGRRMGLIAVLIWPFLSANIDSSTFGYANYLTFYTFFALVVLYAYLRTVKSIGTRRWVESYANPRQIIAGVRGWLRTERTAVKWSVFTGVSLGAFALAWQGYTYAVVVIGISLLILAFVERVRKVDWFGLYLSAWIIGPIAFAMATPYYAVQGELGAFLTIPVLLYFGTLAVLTPFLLMRDVPWVFSVPALLALGAAAFVVLKVAFPKYFVQVVSGQGYFVKNLIYSTIAEAQAPSIDALVVGYGVVTFFLAFIGLGLVAFLLIRTRFRRYLVVFMVFAVLTVYLPISASKFFVIGSPAFALLSALAIHRALDLGAYPNLRRSVASLSDRGGRFTAFRKSFKARHVLILGVVAVILVPNVWVSLDAGIPGNTKSQFAVQINDTIPSYLKLNASAPASNLLGAAGSSLDTSNQYDSAGYNWLATQDTNVPEQDRPAVDAWWDYGFQTIDQGQHPSVADNFQNGIDPAGQFLLAQNESLAIAVMTTTLLSAEELKTGLPDLPPALNTILGRDGVDTGELHKLLVNEGSDYNLVVNNPTTYLAVNPSTLSDDNAMYDAVSYFLAGSLSLTAMARVYDAVEAYTGWSIGYGMADTRLIPFSGTDTGIFYAPADLTGRVINAAGLPSTYFNVTVLGSDGNVYPLGSVPADVTSVEYEINYNAAFYNSMIYHIYFGYNGTQIGVSGGGIPGLTGAAADYPVEPGWMMQHFMEVYRTAYVCPGVKNALSGSGCFYATNTPNAVAIAKKTGGSADTSVDSYFSGGESILAYYSGETLIGSVRLPDGAPAAGIRATVYDSWGIPHMTAVTGTNGTFTVILPPGNDTLNLTTGALDGLTQSGANLVQSIHLDVPESIGYSLDPQTTVLPITIGSGTVNGVVFWNVANQSSYVPSSDLVAAGAHVVLSESGIVSYSAVTDASGTFSLGGIPPGTYNVSITYEGANYTGPTENVTAGGTTNATAALPAGTVQGTVKTSSGYPYGGAIVNLMNGSTVLGTTTSNASGDYVLHGFPSGNYTLNASVPGTTLRSIPVALNATNTSANLTASLVLGPVGTAAVEVVYAGEAVPGLPVRFTPLVSFLDGSATSLTMVSNATGSGVVVMTDAAGVARVDLAPGTYSVYALGYAGTVLAAGLAQVSVVAGATAPTLAVNLTAAVPVSGTLPEPGSPGTAFSSVLLASPTSGAGEAVAVGNANGTFSLLLPSGTYDLLSFESPGGSSLNRASLGTLDLTRATTVVLAASTVETAEFTVGTNGSSGFVGAAGVNVTVSAGPSGPAVRQISSPSGSVAFQLPSNVTEASGGYCVAASGPGLTPRQECGFTAAELGSLSTFNLTAATVSVSLSVLGVPTGTPVTVNFTAASATAVSRSLTGGPAFSFGLAPGNYSVVGGTSAPNGTVLYRTPSAVNVTIPAGAASARITLRTVPEEIAKGTLSLPKKIVPANVTVSLASPELNVSVNGTRFTEGFRIAVGNYTVRFNGTNATAGLRYANLTYVDVGPDGSILPTLVLNRPAVTLSGSFVVASGAALNVTPPVTLTNTATGATVTVIGSDGAFSVVLPPNGTYSVRANTTVLATAANGTVDETWSSVPGATCSVGSVASTCSIELVGTIAPAWFNGTVVRPGVAGAVPASLHLTGPYPSTDVTVLNATNGTFSALLAPGTYRVYGVATGGAELAGFGRALVLPSSGSFTLDLLPSWSAEIVVDSSGAPSQTVGAANVTVRDGFGDWVVFPSVNLGTTLRVVLPVGTYTVNASAPGTLHGFAGTAVASATVDLLSGNAGVSLPLAVPVSQTVVATLVAPTGATVATGASATFSYSLRDVGNAPVTVHGSGSPAFWNFTFSVPSVTLEPGGPSATGEVRVVVPAGTLTDHVPVAVTFENGNGTKVGTLSPAPTVNVLPYYGVAVARVPTDPVEVGTSRVLVTVYLANRGNTQESIRMSVTNLKTLGDLGWSVAITTSAGSTVSFPQNLAGGGNNTYLVNLTTSATVYAPPGSVAISATVVNGSGAVSSTTIAIPTGAVQPGKSSLFFVTGPSVGVAPSVLPQYAIAALAFVPAIALAAVVLTYRWWRTRKWIRR